MSTGKLQRQLKRFVHDNRLRHELKDNTKRFSYEEEIQVRCPQKQDDVKLGLRTVCIQEKVKLETGVCTLL